MNSESTSFRNKRRFWAFEGTCLINSVAAGMSPIDINNSTRAPIKPLFFESIGLPLGAIALLSKSLRIRSRIVLDFEPTGS